MATRASSTSAGTGIALGSTAELVQASMEKIKTKQSDKTQVSPKPPSSQLQWSFVVALGRYRAHGLPSARRAALERSSRVELGLSGRRAQGSGGSSWLWARARLGLKVGGRGRCVIASANRSVPSVCRLRGHRGSFSSTELRCSLASSALSPAETGFGQRWGGRYGHPLANDATSHPPAAGRCGGQRGGRAVPGRPDTGCQGSCCRTSRGGPGQ